MQLLRLCEEKQMDKCIIRLEKRNKFRATSVQKKSAMNSQGSQSDENSFFVVLFTLFISFYNWLGQTSKLYRVGRDSVSLTV